MASASVVELTDANFDQEVMKSSTPVLVDFWAPWCQPCLRLGPTIDAIAEQYKDKVKVGKLNIDEHSAAAMTYRVQSIPTVLLFKDGAVQKQYVGLVAKAEIEKTIDAMLGNG